MPQNEIRYDGRAILITGAGRGLGRAQALLLASRGARVVVADNGTAMDGEDPDSSPAHTVVAEIEDGGGTAVACTADLATESGARRAVEAALDSFGRIDGIIHNASTSPDLCSPDRLSDRDLDLVMRINPMAAFWMVRAAWSPMREQEFGRILLMPSAAIYGALGNTHYATAKSAYLGMMRCLALEGADHGIMVNAAMPAARSRMTERLQPSAFTDWFMETMTPEKVAVGAAYLVSDECGVNGEMFAIGGGRIARVVIAEAEGVTGTGDSIEGVRDAMTSVMADTRFFYPRDLSERSVRVNSVLGFEGGMQASKGYAVKSGKED